MCPSDKSRGVARSEAPRGKNSETLRIWLLGGFRVGVGSRTIPQDAWRLRKAAALVKLLALAPGHRLHREQVMDLLWPDSGRKAASNSLRKALHVARRILDPATGSRYLVSEDESLVLCPRGDLWIDVEAFEEAAATARRSAIPQPTGRRWSSTPASCLPEDRYEEWAEEPRRAVCGRLYLSLARRARTPLRGTWGIRVRPPRRCGGAWRRSPPSRRHTPA